MLDIMYSISTSFREIEYSCSKLYPDLFNHSTNKISKYILKLKIFMQKCYQEVYELDVMFVVCSYGHNSFIQKWVKNDL